MFAVGGFVRLKLDSGEEVVICGMLCGEEVMCVILLNGGEDVDGKMVIGDEVRRVVFLGSVVFGIIGVIVENVITVNVSIGVMEGWTDTCEILREPTEWVLRVKVVILDMVGALVEMTDISRVLVRTLLLRFEE